MAIIGMMIVKNEADRYLRQSLEKLDKVCDYIIIVDDGSTDNTLDICAEFNCDIYETEENMWENKEVEIRKMCFDIATKNAEDGDWLICLDADEVLTNSEGLRELALHMSSNKMFSQVNGIAFRLYDMWSDKEYRDDKYWTAHNRPWLMMFKYSSEKEYVWNEQNLHCGRLPLNASDLMTFTQDIKIKHMGWATKSDRQFKYDRYMRIDPEGKYGDMNQYLSILDEKPNLRRFE